MWTPWKRKKSHQAANSAEERVRQFLTDYQAQWRVAETLHARVQERDDVFDDFFPRWRDMMRPVKERHFVEGSSHELADSFSNRPEYASRTDKHVRSEAAGDTTYVLVENEGGMYGKFHEYVVNAVDGDFKILDIVVHYGDPVLPFLDAKSIAARQRECSLSAPLAVLREEEALLDENHNFTDRDVRDEDGGVSRARVTQVGDLVTDSGVIAVWDFGWDNDEARPLARAVAPGSHPVDRITAFGRNAAVRVRFTGETPVTWRAAEVAGRGGNDIGVDAGCVCLVDFAAYASMTPRAKAGALASVTEAERPVAVQFTAGVSNLGLVCDSGWGDGSYPMYWGIDARGEIAQLVVDFFVLVDSEDRQWRHI